MVREINNFGQGKVREFHFRLIVGTLNCMEQNLFSFPLKYKFASKKVIN